MQHTIIGVLDDRADVEHVIEALTEKGYDPHDISVIMRDQKEATELDDTGVTVAGGAISGATTGAVLGGLAGLLGIFAIPSLGAFLIGGPIATALGLTGAAAATVSGAVTGATAGGFVGGLMGLGISADDAKMYQDRVNSGGVFVAIPAYAQDEKEVEHVLSNNNATDIRRVNSSEIESEEDVTSSPTYTDYPYEPSYATYGAKGGKAEAASEDVEEKPVRRIPKKSSKAKATRRKSG